MEINSLSGHIDENIIALAHRMADAAGDILRRAARSPLRIDMKADASPVTEIDREVETALRQLIEHNYPQHGIVGEEYDDVRPEAAYQWVLDPIDGTRSFIAGYHTFATLIALIKNGTPVLGVIDQPVLRERWIGIIGESTRFNGQAIHIHKPTKLKQAIVATTSTAYFTPHQAELFTRLRQSCSDGVLGGDAYAYAMLAMNRLDLVVDAGMKPYDFCALIPVIQGAGGIITDWSGQTLSLSSDGTVIAAANRDLHTQALSMLRPAAI